MITPPHEWKAMISSKPAHQSNHCHLTRTSNIPNLACMDFCRKVQESLPGDKIRTQAVELRDWKYKFKTGDLIRIPLSNIMSRPAENEAHRLRYKKLNYCKWTYAESGSISNEDEIHALTKSAISRHVSHSRSQNTASHHRSVVLTMPLTKGSIMTISAQNNHDPYCNILRESMSNLRRYNIEDNFRNSAMKHCSEIPKSKFPETKRTLLKAPFTSQAINIKLEKSFKYKVNANELPRSQTPLNEKDPDKMSFKNVASFLSDDPESDSSVDNQNSSDLDPGAIEAANPISGSDTTSEKTLDHSCQPENGSCLRLAENTEAMNLVSADVFTSPSRSVHSCGAFKTSFRLRRAPRHGTKTKKENDYHDTPPQSEHRIKLQKFLDIAVSTRVKTMHKDNSVSIASSKEFLQVPSQHYGFEKQLLVAGSEASFENSQESNGRCHTEMRESSTAKTLSEKDCKSHAEVSKQRQYSFSYSDRKAHGKRTLVQKSHSELSNVLVKDQPQEKGGKNPENSSSIKSAHSVVIIPACTPIANDGGNSSDSEIVSDQPTMDARCRRPTSLANLSNETTASLNSGSNLSSASSSNATALTVFSRPKPETSHQNRNQKSKTVADEPEQLPATKLKDYPPVKLTFRKERIISNKNSEFLSKFLNSDKNKEMKIANS